jgi:hypothetical protein
VKLPIALASVLASDRDPQVESIAVGMDHLLSELVAIASMSSNILASLAYEDPNREDMLEIERAARLALAKLEKLGHRAPRLGVV